METFQIVKGDYEKLGWLLLEVIGFLNECFNDVNKYLLSNVRLWTVVE